MGPGKKSALPKTIQLLVAEECHGAISESGAQVFVRDLCTIDDAAQEAYANQPEGTTREARLKAARTAADAKVAELKASPPPGG